MATIRYKDRSYGNRGMALEDYIRFANDRYKHAGVAVISKQATEFKPLRDHTGRICNAKVEEKATVDFLGRYKRHPIAIEAKHTSGDAIRFDEVQEHQADFMDDFTVEPGTIGLVVVSFGMKRFFAIPWSFWKAAYNARVRPGSSRTAPAAVEGYGVSWTIPPKFSVRMEEIPAQFEVPDYDPNYGLGYLINVERYIQPSE